MIKHKTKTQQGVVSARMEPLPITVVIPVKNEEVNLPRCLASLSRFAVILVVDSKSTDRTVEIAKQASAEVLPFEWNGSFPKKRNWVLMTYSFETDWVLFLDADEVIDDSFCDALSQALANGGADGYWLNYTNYFMNRRLRYGLPQRKLALFRVGAGLYERIEENGWSKLDMEIHEHPVVDGVIDEIKAPIEHNDYRGIAKFIDRHTDYARWEAGRYLSLGDKSQQQKWTSRQRFKYRSIESWWFSWFYFVFVYFFRIGFMDGAPGFHYALYKSWYFRTIRLLIKEAKFAR